MPEYTDDPAVSHMLIQRLREQLSVRLVSGQPPRAKVGLVHTVPCEQGLTVTGKATWDVFNAFMGARELGVALLDAAVGYTVFGHTHEQHDFEFAGMRCVNSAAGRYRGAATPAAIQEHVNRCLRHVTL